MRTGQPFSPYRLFQGPILPECLIPYEKISWGAKILLAIINRYIGRKDVAWPGQERLAEMMGVSVRSISGYVSELESDGFIEVIQRGLGQTNMYRALWHPIFEEEFADDSDQHPQESSEAVADGSSGLLHLSSEKSQKAIESDSFQQDSVTSDQRADFQTFRRIWERHRFKISQRQRREASATWKLEVTETQLDAAVSAFRDWASSLEDGLGNPLAVFLKDPARWIPAAPPPPRATPPLAPPVDLPPPDVGPVAPAASYEASGNLWNRLNPDALVFLDRYYPTKAVAQCEADPQYLERREEAARLAGEIRKVRGAEVGWINFRWFVTAKDENPPGWYRLLTDLRWMAEKPNGRPLTVDACDEAIRMIQNGTL